MEAVILAGGEATRMRPFTDDRPKSMIEVAGAPILEHQIKWLALNGVKRVVLSCGYKAEVIQGHIGDGGPFGIEAVYAIESKALGRGGGLKFAASHLGDKGSAFFALNGDVLAGFSLKELADFHRSIETLATVALAPYKTSWGIADLDGNLIKGFRQSPILPYWINAGIYVLEPEVVGMLPDEGDHEDTTFPELAEQGKLGGFQIRGYWRGIDTVKDVREATQELQSN